MLFDSVDKVVGVFFAYVLYSEIIDNKGEINRSPIVHPHTGWVLALMVSLTVETLLKELLGKDYASSIRGYERQPPLYPLYTCYFS